MKGILTDTWHFVDVDLVDVYEQEDVIRFNKGDEVEILRVIVNTDLFLSKVAYVVFNNKNSESITLDSSCLELINE